MRKHLLLAAAAVMALTGSGVIAGATLEPAGPVAPVAARQGLAPARSQTPENAKTPGNAKTPEKARRCTLDRKLVPSCGLLWGVAPGAFTDLSPARALVNFEHTTGRPADILHSYH